MNKLPPATPVRIVEGISREQFDAEIRPARQPVLLKGIGSAWPVVEAARRSPEEAMTYLRRFSHPRPVPAIVGPPDIRGRFFYNTDLTGLNFTRGQTPLGPFLDRLLRDQREAEPFAIAIQSIKLPDLLPGFVGENMINLLDPAVVPRIWLGNSIRVATHYDLMENIGIVVAGRRRFTLFPPEQVANLYMGPMEVTPAGTPVSMVDPLAPDLSRYPRFAAAQATAQEAMLEPGDAIYIPYHWWHAVDSLEPINAFVNYWWNPAPAGRGSPYDALLFALRTIKPLPEDQRAAIRAVFDHLVFGVNGDPVAHLPSEAHGVLGASTSELDQQLRTMLQQTLAK